MHDQVDVSHDRVHESNRGTDFSHVSLAPGISERVFNAALDRHDFEKRVVEQAYELPFNQFVNIPELIYLHEVRIICRDDKIRIIFEEQVGNIGQADEAIQLRGADSMKLAKLVT